MSDTLSVRTLKLFVVVISALILALAAFGIGVNVGAVHGAVQARAGSPLPSLQTESPESEPASTAAMSPRATATPVPTAAATNASEPKTDSSSAPLNVDLFNEAWGLLQDQFYGELPTGEDITYAAIRGVIDSLGDQHTAFLTPKQAAMFNADMQGQFEGIGARVDIAEGGGVEIKYLFADQPAQKADIRVGDVIVSVDGTDVTGLDLNDAISLIRGPRGTQVVLTIRRGQEEQFEVTITRARIEIPVIETKTFADGKVEYIALSEFSSIAPARLGAALEQAVSRKPSGIILDLRGNPGGLLDAAVRIGSFFVPEGNILIERFKDQPEEIHQRKGRYLLADIPLVVLVDGGSASAAEIVAGAIQDAGTGKLIGEKTYGKGSVQLPNALSDGSQLRVTIANWYTPKDRQIDKKGLDPDIAMSVTEEDVKAGRDPQIDRAVEFLLTGK
jgi:carboxyl-terminal processing protease